MSAAKTLFKAGVGAGALVLGAGALVYECALNTKINSYFINKFDDTRPDLEGAEQVNTAPVSILPTIPPAPLRLEVIIPLLVQSRITVFSV